MDAGFKLVRVGGALIAHKPIAVVVHPLGHGGVHIQRTEEGEGRENFPQLLQQIPLRVPQLLDAHGAVERQGNGVNGSLGLLLSGDAEDFRFQSEIEVQVHLPVGNGGGKDCGNHLIALVLEGPDDAGEGVVVRQILEDLSAAEDVEVVLSGDNGVEGVGFMLHRCN